MHKRLLGLLTAFTMMISAPAEGTTAAGIMYTVRDGQAIVYAYSGTKTDLVIPAQAGGYPVVAVEDIAFWGYSHLTSVFVEFGVERIGDGAFSECTELSWVVLPATVRSIGPGTFQACRSLTWFVIPRSIASIGAYAFNLCTALEQMQIPGTVETIERYAFNRCSSLQTVEIAEGTVSIGECAFAQCAGLAQISLPSTLQHLGDDIFYGSNPSAVISFAGTRAQWMQLTENKAGYAGLEIRCADDPGPPITAAPTAHFKIEGNLITGITVGRGTRFMRLRDLLVNLVTESGCSLQITVPETADSDPESPVSTGTRIRAIDSAGDMLEELTVIVMGDVCETGLMNIAQIVRLAQMLRDDVDAGAAFLAGDWNGNGTLDIADLNREAALLRAT